MSLITGNRLLQMDPTKTIFLVNEQNVVLLPENGRYEEWRLDDGARYKVSARYFSVNPYDTLYY